VRLISEIKTASIEFLILRLITRRALWSRKYGKWFSLWLLNRKLLSQRWMMDGICLVSFLHWPGVINLIMQNGGETLFLINRKIGCDLSSTCLQDEFPTSFLKFFSECWLVAPSSSVSVLVQASCYATEHMWYWSCSIKILFMKAFGKADFRSHHVFSKKQSSVNVR